MAFKSIKLNERNCNTDCVKICVFILTLLRNVWWWIVVVWLVMTVGSSLLFLPSLLPPCGICLGVQKGQSHLVSRSLDPLAHQQIKFRFWRGKENTSVRCNDFLFATWMSACESEARWPPRYWRVEKKTVWFSRVWKLPFHGLLGMAQISASAIQKTQD